MRHRRMRSSAIVRETGTSVKPGESIDHVGSGVGPHPNRATVRSYWENVGSPSHR